LSLQKLAGNAAAPLEIKDDGGTGLECVR